MPVGDSTPHGPVIHEVRATGENPFTSWVLPLLLVLLATPWVLRWKVPELSTSALVIAEVIAFVLLSGLVLLLWLRQSRAKVQITPTHVIRTRATGRDTLARSELAQAVIAEKYKVMGVPSPILFLTDSHTRTRLTLRAPVWSEEALHQIGQAAQSLTVLPVLTAEDGRTHWSNMMPWSHRHPYLAMAAGGGATALVSGVLIFLAVRLS